MGRVLPILFINTEMVRATLDNRKTKTRLRIDIDIVNNCDMERDGTLLDYQDKYGDFINPVKLCRYQPGDILYVRETWGEWTDGYVYKAWNEPFPQAGCYPGTKWRPSIHMPKEAARIWLKVTDVRVERLQDIDDDGVVAEGLQIGDPFDELWDSTIKKPDRALYGWDANPCVWVIEFERCEKPEPCILKGIQPAEDKRPCIGYGMSDISDEPCEMCKGCAECSGNDDYEQCEKPESEG